ncbi:MAG: SNF2-related protein [Catalinimonas sp.]
MNVSTDQPFQITYALYNHEYLGFLLESFVVQRDELGRLTLQNQNISSKNAPEFAEGLDEVDFRLIQLMDDIQQDAIVKRFRPKKMSTPDFFLKYYHPEKGDKQVQGQIDTFVEEKKALILPLLHDRHVFEMGNDGEPTWKRLHVAPERSYVRFFFRRDDKQTIYKPIVTNGGEEVDFQYKDAMIVCYYPAWLLLGNCLYHFEEHVDGNKLKPFLNKKFITIPHKVEETYYRKFVTQLVEAYDVQASGFTINTEQPPLRPVIHFAEQGDDESIRFCLNFHYNGFSFPANAGALVSVAVEKTADSYAFHRVARQKIDELRLTDQLRDLGLDFGVGHEQTLPKVEALQWLNDNAEELRTEGFEVEQRADDRRRYFIGRSTINLEVKEDRDWFDIRGTVHFGPYEVPFMKLRKLIVQKKREFELPNGEIALIPEEWFTRYSELLAFTEERGGDALKLQKHHLALVKELEVGQMAQVAMSRKLEKLREFEQIDDVPLPAGFEGTLRPYQKAGYNWMLFLNKYRFGGCLADDMGLGKTIQALALLQHEKENGAQTASLLVMPTSLVYNWEMEAKRFTPNLRVFVYTGTQRVKDVKQFEGYDLILTSYGIARIDVEMLREYYFHYVILDESQAIKNPASNVAKAVKRLRAHQRLILTGTPLENSTLDLWSQMNFVNPGLLGPQGFFRQEFLTPIEKHRDEEKTRKLYSIIKPFVLRRHKSQVARELPDKIEQVQYCIMTEQQEKVYEEAKSYYRNKILDFIEHNGVSKSQLILLQGLTTLRQLANHPRMLDEGYEGDSGKLDDVFYKLESILEEDHKVLIFSQFVKHLSILRRVLDGRKIKYAYLDGSTKDRRRQVENFQNDPELKVFLISLKAGGVGLNLTAADYVFILDPWWNPAIEAQAVDRAHRIGQQRQVFTYKFITRNTVEEKILMLQQDKQRLASELITTEENFVKSLSKDDIMSILV